MEKTNGVTVGGGPLLQERNGLGRLSDYIGSDYISYVALAGTRSALKRIEQLMEE